MGNTRGTIRRTITIRPETAHALAALALPGEAIGATIDRLIAERELTPPWAARRPRIDWSALYLDPLLGALLHS